MQVLTGMEPVIIVHGGAGTHALVQHDDVQRTRIEDGVKAAAAAGYRALRHGGCAVDAVEAAVMSMEKDPTFNAGRGSYLTQDGTVEMDAAIMDGGSRRGGAVACITHVAHAVHVARLVMDKSDHVLMTSEGAQRFAESQGVPIIDRKDLITDKAINHLKKFTKFNPSVKVEFHLRGKSWEEVDSSHDTVGAVALDNAGNTAAASSTGGINAKLPGRVGDSAVIGCGCYADSRVGAVTTTGHGEAFIKTGFSRAVLDLIKGGVPCEAALQQGLEDMRLEVQGTGGAICVSNQGETAVSFNTQGMSWCRIQGNQLTHGIYQGEVLTEPYTDGL